MEDTIKLPKCKILSLFLQNDCEFRHFFVGIKCLHETFKREPLTTLNRVSDLRLIIFNSNLIKKGGGFALPGIPKLLVVIL